MKLAQFFRQAGPPGGLPHGAMDPRHYILPAGRFQPLMSQHPTRGECLTFELQPRLVGALVELRPLTRADYDAVYAAGSDPLIWEQHPQSDRYKPDVFRAYFEGAIESGGAFAVVDRASGRVIGCTRFCNLKPEESEVEIGWTFLERAQWGGAVNGEMKSLMLDHALRFVERVVFVIGEENRRSRKAVEKIGGTLFRDAERIPGRPPVPFVVYAITRSRYQAVRGD